VPDEIQFLHFFTGEAMAPLRGAKKVRKNPLRSLKKSMSKTYL
jgi:hypothetical protein